MVVVAGHIHVIEAGDNGKAAERNLVTSLGFGEPAFFFNPRVRSFLLEMLFVEDLLKQAVMVV